MWAHQIRLTLGLAGIFLLLVTSTSTQSCIHDVGASYGDARTGGGAFSELVGVACGGKCYEKESKWSAVAVTYGDRPVILDEICRRLCLETLFCEVWTNFWEEGRCELKRAAPVAPALGRVSEQTTTGSAKCDEVIAFPCASDSFFLHLFCSELLPTNFEAPDAFLLIRALSSRFQKGLF